MGDVKANSIDFYRYISRWKKDKQGIPPLNQRTIGPKLLTWVLSIFEMNLKVIIEDCPWTVNMLIGSQAHIMGLFFMSLLRIMNPRVCTMSFICWLCHVTWTIWQTFVHPSHRGSTWNLTLICLVVSEEKRFENVDRWRQQRLLILLAHQWA